MNSELQKQWEQDVAHYGDNAYLMWEWSFEKRLKQLICNAQISIALNFNADINDIYRKDSAALPFDLERAKAGDIVEWMVSDDKWVDVENIIFLENGSIAVSNVAFGKGVFVDVDSYLRMKYPPKVSNGSAGEFVDE